MPDAQTKEPGKRRRRSSGNKKRRSKDNGKTPIGITMVALGMWLVSAIYVSGYGMYSNLQAESKGFSLDPDAVGDAVTYRLVVWIAVTGVTAGILIGKKGGAVLLYISFALLLVAHGLWYFGTRSYYSKTFGADAIPSELLLGATLLDWMFLATAVFLVVWQTGAQIKQYFGKQTTSRSENALSN